MKELLNSEDRIMMWKKASELVEKISKVIPIRKATVIGSFTTSKPRPADVDFIILLQTCDEHENWSADIVFAPNNKFGKQTLDDAIAWMQEKYGNGNYKIIDFIPGKTS